MLTTDNIFLRINWAHSVPHYQFISHKQTKKYYWQSNPCKNLDIVVLPYYYYSHLYVHSLLFFFLHLFFANPTIFCEFCRLNFNHENQNPYWLKKPSGKMLWCVSAKMRAWTMFFFFQFSNSFCSFSIAMLLFLSSGRFLSYLACNIIAVILTAWRKCANVHPI